MGEGSKNLVYPSPWDFKSYFTCRKSYDMGPPSLLPIVEEGVLRIFIALKNPSPWPGSNPPHVGPLASTLTNTSPRRILVMLVIGCPILVLSCKGKAVSLHTMQALRGRGTAPTHS
jgi:hypothetical protein